MRTYSVLHGFQASAGQPGLMARGLRDVGIDASNVVVGPNRFGYAVDFAFPESSRSAIRQVLGNLALNFDVLHIHAITPFFTRGGPNYPMGTDLLALRAAGKRIVIHFRGSEIRLASMFKAASPYNYVDDDPDGLIAKFPEEGQRAYIDLCRALADEIVVSDPELLTYAPGARIIHRAIDLSEWRHVGISDREKPLVVHAPSRQGVKGTRHVLTAVDDLKREGLNFEFRLIEGLSQTEARAAYEEADIVIDQLRIGWYGVLAVEAMALGKAVISYVRDDLISHLGDELPIHIGNPDTIKDRLRELVLSKSLRQETANRGYKFCVRNHDVRIVAAESAKLYSEVLQRPAKFDMKAYMAVQETQDKYAERALIEAKRRGAHNTRTALALSTTSTPTLATALEAAQIHHAARRWSSYRPRELYGYYRRVGAKSFLKAALRRLLGGKWRTWSLPISLLLLDLAASAPI